MATQSPKAGESDYQRLAALRQRRGLGFFIETALFDNGFQAVKLHRAAHWFKIRRIPFFGALLWRINIWCTGVDINPNARIGTGLIISHGVGLVVGGDAVIGQGCLLHHGVTLGAPTTSRIAQCPQVGSNVTIGAGANLIGAIQIGDGAFVGAGALVTVDVPSGGKALAPTAIIDGPATDENTTQASA